MVQPRTVLFGCAVAAAVGCYTGSSTDANAPPDPSTTSAPSDPARHDGGRPALKATGLPCDVAAIVANACDDCHGPTPSGGTDTRLATYTDFAAPSPDDPSTTVAAHALARMQSDTRPMPPGRKLADDTIAVFAKWVAAGLPKGMCGQVAPGADAAPPRDDPPPPPGDDDAGHKDDGDRRRPASARAA
jgi:hypothetical protein